MSLIFGVYLINHLQGNSMMLIEAGKSLDEAVKVGGVEGFSEKIFKVNKSWNDARGEIV